MKTPFTTRATRHPAVIETLGGSAARSTPNRRRLPKLARPVMLALAGLLVLGALVWVATHPTDRGAEPAPVAAPPATAGPAPTKADPAECVATNGNQSTGAEAVKAFEYAYYVERSAAAARKFVTPTSTVMTAEALQPLIDALPAGTTHCVRTTSLGERAPGTEEVFGLVLIERRPGLPAKQYAHTVTTKKLDGLWFVDVFK